MNQTNFKKSQPHFQVANYPMGDGNFLPVREVGSLCSFSVEREQDSCARDLRLKTKQIQVDSVVWAWAGAQGLTMFRHGWVAGNSLNCVML